MKLALLACCALWAQDTHVILLGTGNPNPEPERSGPALAVVTNGQPYIVDFGPGVVRRAASAGLKMEGLTRAFVTHLHSDHTAGYADLIFTPAVTGRLAALEVYGPPGLRAMTRHLLAAYREDMKIRLHGLEPAVPAAYEVRAREVKPGVVYRDANLTVKAFAVPHGAWKHAYGYRFEARDKTVVVSGDTAFSEELIAQAAGCDILVHEAYSESGWRKRTPDWQRYHATYHTSAADVGRVASRVRPRVLVLHHQLPMGEAPDQMLREVATQWNGQVLYGKDLDVIR